MKKLLKIIPALVFAACCFMFAAKCLKAGGFIGAIADFPTAIHRAVKGQMQTTTDYLNGEQTEYDESVFTGEYHYYYEKLSDDDKLIYRQIYAMMQKRMDGISLNTTDTDNVSRIQQFVVCICPFTALCIAVGKSAIAPVNPPAFKHFAANIKQQAANTSAGMIFKSFFIYSPILIVVCHSFRCEQQP
jgi:hypothetical protein